MGYSPGFCKSSYSLGHSYFWLVIFLLGLVPPGFIESSCLYGHLFFWFVIILFGLVLVSVIRYSSIVDHCLSFCSLCCQSFYYRILITLFGIFKLFLLPFNVYKVSISRKFQRKWQILKYFNNFGIFWLLLNYPLNFYKVPISKKLKKIILKLFVILQRSNRITAFDSRRDKIIS